MRSVPKGFYRDLIKLLQKHGCFFKRQAAGDHEYWCNPRNGKCISVDKITHSKKLANRVLKYLEINEKL
jgi:hypothetical protein